MQSGIKLLDHDAAKFFFHFWNFFVISISLQKHVQKCGKNSHPGEEKCSILHNLPKKKMDEKLFAIANQYLFKNVCCEHIKQN